MKTTNLSSERLKLLHQAYFFLKFRPRTKKEMENYLCKKIKNHQWLKNKVSSVIKQLEKENLINDEKFINWFVEQRILLKPKSQFVLKKELLQKGIKEELINDYFAKNHLDEEALVFQALKQRWPRLIYLEKRKRFEKAASFLLRRGFSFETIKKAIAKMEENSKI